MILLNLLMVFCLSMADEFPEYEQSLSEKIPAGEKIEKEEQSAFYQLVNQKSMEVAKFLRMSKDTLTKKQIAVKKEFEDGVKKQLADLKAAAPTAAETKTKSEEIRKAATEKRKELFAKLNEEKKMSEEKWNSSKKQFDDFVKSKKEIVQQLIKNMYAKARAAKLAKPEDTALDREFREIPPGKGTVLSPNN